MIFRLTIITVLILFSGCKPDLFTDLSICEATITIDESTIVDGELSLSGNIQRKGDFEIQYIGFCHNKTGNPAIDEGQVLYNYTSDDYEFNLKGFAPNDTIYYKTFVAYDCGYELSEEQKIVVPKYTEPTVPCTLSVPYMSLSTGNNSQFNVSLETFDNKFIVVIKASYFSRKKDIVRIEFQSKPRNGVYTVSSTVFGGGKVTMSHYNGFNYPVISKGGKVYVTNQDNGDITIQICDVAYEDSNNGIIQLNARLLESEISNK